MGHVGNYRPRVTFNHTRLFWENTGFVLYYKALVEDRFKWPKGDETLLTLTGQQLNGLLDGYDISVMKAHKSRHYESVF